MATQTFRYQRDAAIDQDQLRSRVGSSTTLVAADGGAIIDISIDDATENVVDLDAEMGIIGLTRIEDNPTTDPAASFTPSSNAGGSGGGSVSAIYRFSTTTTESDPGNGRARFDNAVYASVTKVFFDDFADSPTFDMGLIFTTINPGDQLIVQQNDDATRAVIFTIDTITDNGGWWTMEVTYLDDAGGPLIANNKATTFGFIFASSHIPASSAFPIYVFPARKLVSPLVADWVVNALAPLSEDPTNARVHILRFDDTAEQGGGLDFYTPEGATNMLLTLVTRPIAGPAGAVVGKFLVYESTLPDTNPAGAAPTTFSSSIALDDVDFPVTTTLYHYDTTTKSLASWGLTADTVGQLELTRTATGDTVVGDIGLAYVIMRWN